MDLFKTITLDAEIEVDLEEVLSKIATDELIAELDSRNEEFDTPDNRVKYHIIERDFFNSDTLKRHLCDIADCGYYEPTDSLLNKIKDLL